MTALRLDILHNLKTPRLARTSALQASPPTSSDEHFGAHLSTTPGSNGHFGAHPNTITGSNEVESLSR